MIAAASLPSAIEIEIEIKPREVASVDQAR
jgi:hypothetical protein